MRKQVTAGGLAIGGYAPVSIQSMTSTDTRDVSATLQQIERLKSAGCELVRCAVFDTEAAVAMREIKDKAGIPLAADVHFDYRLAIAAVENGVDKLRINPGNIGARERVEAVVSCCRAHHVPIRIGVNAGSLEKNLKERFAGDTVGAMIESALSHVRILESLHFDDIVLSLKCSDVTTTVSAYRKIAEVTDYPLHIGVTETGSGKEALVKSAVGIGTLLMEGIGDTVRVSLTGDPVREIEAAKYILSAAGLRKDRPEIISCPTCGRTRVNLDEISSYVKERLGNKNGYIKVAIMGCAVNGPGEASDADIGIAFGQNNGVLFAKGNRIGSGPVKEITERLIEMAEELLKGEC